MTPDELPPAFRDLGAQLRTAAERDEEIERLVAQRVRRGRWRRWLIVALAAIISGAGVAVADRLLDRKGADEPREQIPQQMRPAADPGVIKAGATPDPRGGPLWAMRVFTNPAGEECVAVGRLLDGALGTYDDTRTFRRLPPTLAGACARLREVGLLIAVQRYGEPERRTVAYGISDGQGPVRITIAGTTRTLRPGPLGSFVDVRAGVLSVRGATASTTIDGRTVTRRLG
ncbi:MAG: hypothetical protein ACRDLN_08810 [Solirubrobacteraceae bacterium]